MSNPRYYLLIIFVFVCLVALVCALLFIPLKQAFMSNWGFNLIIIGALLIGILLNIRRVLILEPEINWIKIFRTGTSGLSVTESPELLKPLAKHLEGLHRDRFSLSALSLRTVLEGIRGRLDESREISRYIIGLLVFLGLLGTFWGLLGTISSVSSIVGGLEVGEENYGQMFQALKAGLQEPLRGMGTAFSSSLFGLGGSLILGFIDIQANHAQNRFFNELEEWLSGVTQLVERTMVGEFEEEGVGLNRSQWEGNRMDRLISELHRTNQQMAALLDRSASQSQDGTAESDENR
ncbi:MAG: hypothetical protein HKN69_11910 [Desulfofustis sp.]|nr:hypothetical protein [Desulfofustis sp.]